MGAPAAATAGGERFDLSGEERDCLTRHATSTIQGSGEEAARHDVGREEFTEAAKHTAVMVRLLEQLGWSTERSIPGTYPLYDDVLPIEQIRVWVERFLQDDQQAIDDAVRNERKSLDDDLQALGVTCRLLARLNARADQRRDRTEEALERQTVAPDASQVAVSDGDPPMLTVAEVRAGRARINATYQVGESLDDANAANKVDRQGDEERMALYERVIGAVAKGNVEDAEQVLRFAIGWEEV